MGGIPGVINAVQMGPGVFIAILVATIIITALIVAFRRPPPPPPRDKP